MMVDIWEFFCLFVCIFFLRFLMIDRYVHVVDDGDVFLPFLCIYFIFFFSRKCHRVYVSCFVGRSPKMNSTCPAYIFPLCEKKSHAILKLPNKTTRNRIQALYGSHAQKIE